VERISCGAALPPVCLQRHTPGGPLKPGVGLSGWAERFAVGWRSASSTAIKASYSLKGFSPCV
jgi:hypothetical protein